jgi:hypothetical protein
MAIRRTTIDSKGFNTKSNDNVSPYSLQAQIEIDKFYKESIKNDKKKGRKNVN